VGIGEVGVCIWFPDTGAVNGGSVEPHTGRRRLPRWTKVTKNSPIHVVKWWYRGSNR